MAEGRASRRSSCSLPGHSRTPVRSNEARLVQNTQGITISLAPRHQYDIATVIGLALDGPASELEPLSLPSGSLALNRPVTASGVWSHEYAAELAANDNIATRWAAERGSSNAWLEVDLGEDTRLTRAVINQHGLNRIADSELQRWTGDSWETFYTSPEVAFPGGKLECAFPPVIARRERLNIIKSRDTATIWEFQLFND